MEFLPCPLLNIVLLKKHEHGRLTDIFLEGVLLHVEKGGVLLWRYETIIIGVYLLEYSGQKCRVDRGWCGSRKKRLPALRNGRPGSLNLG